MPTVYFAHGKESGPWGTKIQHLAAIARRRGCEVESPDYSAIPDPDARVDLLLGLASGKPDLLLVGSSMGGYVSTVAAHTLDTRGLFLMAPALYIPGYRAQRYHPSTRRIAVVHGWHDDIVPVRHSIEFARETHSELHILDGDISDEVQANDVILFKPYDFNRHKVSSVCVLNILVLPELAEL